MFGTAEEKAGTSTEIIGIAKERIRKTNFSILDMNA